MSIRFRKRYIYGLVNKLLKYIGINTKKIKYIF